MKYILANKTSFISAKILRDYLVEKAGEKILVVSDLSKIKNKDSVILSYGNSFHSVPGIVNTPEFISLCANKFIFSRTLLNNNIHTPIYSRSADNLVFPLLIREKLSLSHGRGIIKIKNEEEFVTAWNPSFYWTPFYTLSREYRVHVAGGKILKIFEKILLEENKDGIPIRNNISCHFSIKNIGNDFIKLVETIEQLNSVLGTDCFYGLDIGWDRVNKKYLVLESNSAPGLNQLTAKLYGDFIIDRGESSG
jgi:hypothetical protein